MIALGKWRTRRHASRAALALLVAACASEREDDANARGAGLSVASLSDAERAGAYAVALRGAFDVGPGLVLLLDPAVLPRTRGAQAANELPAEVVRVLRATGTIQGTCVPVGGAQKSAPICAADSVGYVVRVSDIFRLAGDTVQLYLTAETFRPSRDTTAFQPPLRLEQRYGLVRRGGGWVVAQKERLVE